MKRTKPKRSKRNITYHGTSGHPVVHVAKSGARYIMVRSPRGRGVKRLYEGSKYAADTARKVIKRLKL